MQAVRIIAGGAARAMAEAFAQEADEWRQLAIDARHAGDHELARECMREYRSACESAKRWARP